MHKSPAGGKPTNRRLNGAGGVHLMRARGPHLRIIVLILILYKNKVLKRKLIEETQNIYGETPHSNSRGANEEPILGAKFVLFVGS